MDLLDKSAILSEVWLTLRDDPLWAEFVAYNDAGLPLAFSVHHGLVDTVSDHGAAVIDESFYLLCQVLRLAPQHEYYDLDDMLSMSNGPYPLPR